jgi:predicted nucleotidyltransferase
LCIEGFEALRKLFEFTALQTLPLTLKEGDLGIVLFGSQARGSCLTLVIATLEFVR